MKTVLLIAFLFSAVIFSSCKEKKEPEADPTAKICITDSMEQIIHIDSVSNGNIENELKLSGEISFSDNKVVKVFPFSSGKVIALAIQV